jgi:hypothetical protein
MYVHSVTGCSNWPDSWNWSCWLASCFGPSDVRQGRSSFHTSASVNWGMRTGECNSISRSQQVSLYWLKLFRGDLRMDCYAAQCQFHLVSQVIFTFILIL